MKVDLHCHTHFSDGKHSPDFIVQLAIRNELTHLAITDHDCLDALSVLPAGSESLRIINGIEISCAWQHLEIHVVGLFIDPANRNLRGLVFRQQERRRTRVEQMAAKLSALGNDRLPEFLDTLPCSAYTRSHVADFLVTEGICRTRKKAFKTHLGRKGKIHVAAEWCELEDAVSAIRDAGGIPVLAHAGRYPINRKKLTVLVTEFAAMGGDGLEVSYPNIEYNTREQLIGMADEHGLYLSAGSDFHDAAARWTDVGKYPPLPASVDSQCIWQHAKWLPKPPSS